MKRLVAFGVAAILLSFSASAQKMEDRKDDKIRKEQKQKDGKFDRDRDLRTHSMMDRRNGDAQKFRDGRGQQGFRDGKNFRGGRDQQFRHDKNRKQHQKNWKKHHGKKKHQGGKHRGGKHGGQHRYQRS